MLPFQRFLALAFILVLAVSGPAMADEIPLGMSPTPTVGPTVEELPNPEPSPESQGVEGGGAAAGALTHGMPPALTPMSESNSEGIPEVPPDGDDGAGADIQIIFTGNTRGIGMGNYPFAHLRRLRAAPDLRFDDVQTVHGVMAQGDYFLIAPDGQVQSLLDFLAGDEIHCDGPEIREGLPGPMGKLWVGRSGRAAFLDDILFEGEGRSDFHWRPCVNGQGIKAELVDLAGGVGEPHWDLHAFEFRQGVTGSVQAGDEIWPFMVMGEPAQEASRTHHRLLSLLEGNPEALFVDAGNYIDGTSSKGDGLFSRHRDLNFEMLEALSPTALLPGYHELLGGPETVLTARKTRNLPYFASNWKSKDPAQSLPKYWTHNMPNGLTVGFVGVVDPKIASRIPALAEAGITLMDPLLALEAAVNDLQALPEAPDIIICLSTGPAAVHEAIRRRARGIDLLLGDPSFATIRVKERHLELRALSRSTKGAALTLPLDGIGVLDLHMAAEGAHLDRVSFSTSWVSAKHPIDAEVTGRITQTRASLYPALDQPVLVAPNAETLGGFSEKQWRKILCELILEQSDADVAVVRAFGRHPHLPGEMSALWVQEHLTVPDELVQFRLFGSELSTILLKLYGTDAFTCGATAGQANSKVGGRYIDGARTYKIVTTDRTLSALALDGLMGGLYSSLPLDAPKKELLLDENGQPLVVQRAILDGLLAKKAMGLGPQAITDALLKASPSDKGGRWELQVDELFVNFERFRGTDNDVFDQIPETLASAPSSMSMGGGLDITLDYSSENFGLDMRAMADYGRLQVDEGEPQESADDWMLSSSVSLPRFALGVGDKLEFMPYSELQFDSEFTAIPSEADAMPPRQSDLSLTLGVSANRFAYLKRLRLGIFANKDLARFQEKPLEWGGRLYERMAFDLGDTVDMRWVMDLRAYAKTEADDASDMRYRGFSEVRFIFPLAHWLAAACYVQGFALKGRLPETDVWGTSLMTGVVLDMSGVFTLSEH